ncbi:hypothetical protein HC931_01120 [Candidatus Gracilibacteria bacterium]|nr:hypothetical protein [Candidatus Gracilibacteria bacterium]NJP20831.1 hypothetical protein [Hydrococcus sp. CRU_1_1]NJQ96800.1 hypothetical protein [Hydrococcus sp. CSU_1_8]
MISKHNSIRWNEVLGDPFSRNLSPLMLVGDGVTHTKLSRTPGTANKVAHDITYDRDYVMAWLTKKFIQGLQIKDKNDAIAIISEVWDYYEKTWTGGLDNE